MYLNMDNVSHNVHFTSDTHFYHKNVIKYCDRPFESVEEMNETMINNWNSVVGVDDYVFHLGDFSFSNATKTKEIVDRLNGNIILVKGNHDKKIDKSLFHSIFHGLGEVRITYNGVDYILVLCHYAMKVWNKSHYGSYHLYGHSHGTVPDDPDSMSFDVGVDCHNYTPISLEKVIEIMSSKNWKSVDHHK